MAANNAQLVQLWEDNPDTPLINSNLSKMVNFQSESKFLFLSNTDTDMGKWADVVININPWPAGDISYLNKIVYNAHPNFRNAKRGSASTDVDGRTQIYDWDSNVISPYNRLLKMLANTKISVSYINTKRKITQFTSFDAGVVDRVFTYDDIIVDNPIYLANTEYDVYVYFSKLYLDYATIKIVRKNLQDTSWMIGTSDTLSPTGTRVIATRKIGGFKTDSTSTIIEDSIWDLATLKKDIVSEQYKVYKEGVGISLLQAQDIPISDKDHLFPNESNVEGALSDVKGLLENIRTDTYTDNRFGVRLLYSPLKKSGNALVPCIVNEMALKITAGHLDVFGTRVKIIDDIYLATPTTQLRIADGNWVNSISLGPEDPENKNKMYVNPNGSSLIWRVYITDSGKIYFKKPSDAGGLPVWSTTMGGWYDMTPGGGRCIGKFQVSLSGSYYIDKMSITETYDGRTPTNSILVFHGMFCPDGLLPCSGKWLDVSGQDPNSYDVMPVYTLWTNGRWYEELPDLRDRGIKGAPLPVINNAGGLFNYTTRSGGSKDCGFENDIGANYHSHTLTHDHGAGTIRISASGQHASHTIDWQGTATTSFQVTEMVPGKYAAGYDHKHNVIIGGGEHSHASESFIGRTEMLTGVSSKSTEASTWAPYKEVLFCIKKG